MAKKESPGITHTTTDKTLHPAVRDFVTEAASRLPISPGRLQTAVAAALLEPETFGVVESLVSLSEDEASAHRLCLASEGITRALETLSAGISDPLAEVDELTSAEVAAAYIEVEEDASRRRRRVLATSIGVQEAARLVNRSRQALERRRRAGEILALAVKSRWRYPRWQFDPGQPGGILSGLREVLAHLRISPLAAATWLTEPLPQLQGQSAVDVLRSGMPDRVIALAEEHGRLP